MSCRNVYHAAFRDLLQHLELSDSFFIPKMLFLRVLLLNLVLFTMDGQTSSNQVVLDPNPYQAPLHFCDPQPDLVPGGYEVNLRPGHTLLNHNEEIGFNVEPYIKHIYNYDPNEVAYAARGIDDEKLIAIRADTGVRIVFCEIVPQPEEQWGFPYNTTATYTCQAR